MAMAAAAVSSAADSKSTISFVNIVTEKLIDDLRKIIKDAQNKLSPSENDDIPAAAGPDVASGAGADVAATGADVAAGAAAAAGAGADVAATGADVAAGAGAAAAGADVAATGAGAAAGADVDKCNSSFCCCLKGKETVAKESNGGGGGGGSNSIKSQKLHLNGKLEKLGIDLAKIRDSFTRLRTFEEDVVMHYEIVSNRVNNLVTHIKQDDIDTLLGDETINKKLEELDKMLTDMKIHIPSSHKMYTSATKAQTQLLHSDTLRKSHGDSEANVLEKLPILQTSDSFSRSPAFLDIKELYDGLSDFQCKLCLLCFSIFPENVIIKRRILLYWWIGEGLILLDEKKAGTADDANTAGTAGNAKTAAGAAADKILKELVEKGFIEPIDQKYRPVAKSFRMHPLIRSAVIVLSKRVGFFDFDDKGKPTRNFVLSRRACLVGVGSSSKLTETIDKIPKSTETNDKTPGNIEGTSNNNNDNVVQLDQGKLNTLYNVDEQYLKLVPEWFLKLTNVQVLQLGRWLNSAENHIEVEDVKFFTNLRNMKLLMYFSLQGISRISELPDTIGDLTNLRILDLRACHNLEKISSNICLLKYLTHLDMSECYLLDSVPKEIASLSRLEVLKGFVVGDPKGGGNPCTLDDLKALESLRKLSISTGSKDFPREEEVRAIHQFKALLNLKIIWGGNSLEKAIEAEAISLNDSKKDGRAATPITKKLERGKSVFRTFTMRHETQVNETALPDKLEKLDLQCFPHTKRPSWLQPKRLKGVRKLYIRGGRLSDLCDGFNPGGDDIWGVEILFLKHLCELSMDWTEMQKIFPKLKHLEFVQCPKLAFFPSDDKGVWTN